MDQDQKAVTDVPDSLGIGEPSQCAESSQGPTSPTPAQRQKLAETDSGDQIMAEKAFPGQEYSEQEHRLSLTVPTQLMQNKNDHEERDLELAEATVNQHEKDGQEDNGLSSHRRKSDLLRPGASIASEATTDQPRYNDLIEEAVKRGQSIIAQAEIQMPRPLMGAGKWQSTLVKLTVEGITGAACHYFSSDLWRYGGRASFPRQLNWHEVDVIDLRVSYGHIEVSLHEAQGRLWTTWSWSSDENWIFCAHSVDIHVLEMVCGYLNLAAGRRVDTWVTGLFALPQYSSEGARGDFVGLPGYLTSSFVRFYPRGPYQPFRVIEALTRVHGIPVEVMQAERPDKDNRLAISDSQTASTKGTNVRFPSAWSTCGGNPCICGDSVMVLDTRQEQLEVRELAPGEQYLAISYVWTQHDGPSLFSYVQRAIEVTGVRSVWIDQMCINQRCDQHKARQIPRMREIYQEGYATVALVPDITESLPIISHAPAAIVPWENLSIARPFIEQMRHCVWRTRCWTWQEGLLGPQGYYVTQKQVLRARMVSDFLAWAKDHVFSGRVAIVSGLMESSKGYSLRCQISTWHQSILIGDLLDAEDHELTQYWIVSQANSLGKALHLTRNRTASRLEDQIYSVLGMVPRGEDFQVVYGESRNAILKRAVNAGLLGAEILDSASFSNSDGESWAAKDDKSRHIGEIYDLGGGKRGSAQIDDNGLKSQFRKLEGLTGVDMQGRNHCVLKLSNSEGDLTGMIDNGEEEELRTLGGRVEQVLFLGERRTSKYTEKALFASGTGRNVVRLAVALVYIEPWKTVETQLVWRVVG